MRVTYHLSKPGGGALEYLRWYSRTASGSVLLARASFASHSFSACSMRSRMGCLPPGCTSSRPSERKVWEGRCGGGSGYRVSESRSHGDPVGAERCA